jgi:hypothetical protein
MLCAGSETRAQRYFQYTPSAESLTLTLDEDYVVEAVYGWNGACIAENVGEMHDDFEMLDTDDSDGLDFSESGLTAVDFADLDTDSDGVIDRAEAQTAARMRIIGDLNVFLNRGEFFDSLSCAC